MFDPQLKHTQQQHEQANFGPSTKTHNNNNTTNSSNKNKQIFDPQLKHATTTTQTAATKTNKIWTLN